MLQGVFDKLVCVTRRSERFRHSLGALDSVVAKYFATIVGWTVVSRPFVNRDHPRHASSTPAEVYQGACRNVAWSMLPLVVLPRHAW